MTQTHQKPVVFLIDVDNTLLDNDSVIVDLECHLSKVLGDEAQRLYWALFDKHRKAFGYADYLGALQLFRNEHVTDTHFMKVALYLLDYPFANRLYPQSLDVIKHLGAYGTPVILSDGDVVFQPHKIQRSGLMQAVSGQVLIYIHKEQQLDDVLAKYPAEHYVLIDDKLRILTAFKQAWADRVTTVFPRQGHYAQDPQILAENPPPDLSIDHIGALLRYDLSSLKAAAQGGGASPKRMERL